jgi:hypothetical protein
MGAVAVAVAMIEETTSISHITSSYAIPSWQYQHALRLRDPAFRATSTSMSTTDLIDPPLT